MTIDFDTIKVHDLVYYEEAGETGWYIVNDVRPTHIAAQVLGKFYQLILLDKDGLGTIHKVIRTTAVPGAIEALERIEMTAGQPAMDDDPVRVRAREALRAVRGEESK